MNCPFCGKKVETDYTNLSYIESHDLCTLWHHCSKYPDELTVCISVYGKTEEEVIERFSHRAEVKEG